jgi:lysophospholipase L1-like esterase
MPLRTSLGGTQLRVRLTNRYSATPTQLGHVTIGLQQGGANTAGSPTTVTFGGSQSLTMAAGASAVSDPVALQVSANTRLLLSVFIPPGANALPPRHDLADATGYNYNGGDASGASVFPVGNTFSFIAIFDGLDVSAAAPSTVVVMGDSISDGLNLAADSDTRWPDRLAARVAPLGLAVVNSGISGDDVTYDQATAPGIATRWSTDALGQAGVRTVIMQGGINDIRTNVPVTTLEASVQQLVVLAHNAGVRVLLATLTPMAGSSGDTAAEESARSAYNAWVLAGSSGADGVVDFAAALDGGTGALAPAYDSGDHLHPNAAGAAVMADVIATGQL